MPAFKLLEDKIKQLSNIIVFNCKLYHVSCQVAKKK
jgi:hypothetical protein